MKSCQILRPGRTYDSKQGLAIHEGITRESTGSSAICMHLQTIPPGTRARAHKHAGHETAIYVLEGRARMVWGEKLENTMEINAGDLVYIPADVPHLPFNPYSETVRAVLARTDPFEQESVVLLPELEAMAPA